MSLWFLALMAFVFGGVIPLSAFWMMGKLDDWDVERQRLPCARGRFAVTCAQPEQGTKEHHNGDL
jgi:hypothetical protein